MRTPSRRFILVAAVFLIPLSAFADRYVVINGMRLNEPQIQYMEWFYHIPIVSGRYWFNSYTGWWGYEVNPRPMGYISNNRGYNRGNSGARRHQSLSPRAVSVLSRGDFAGVTECIRCKSYFALVWLYEPVLRNRP